MGNFTQVPNWILAKLYNGDLAFRETRVFAFLVRKLYGYHKTSDKISYSQIAEATGISRRDVIRIIAELEKKKILAVKRKDHCINIIRIKGSGDITTRGGGKKGQKVVVTEPPSKENQKDGTDGLVFVTSPQAENKNYAELMEEMDFED